MLGLTLAYKSMHERGIAHARRAVELSQGAAFFVGFLGDVCAATGCRDEAQRILERLQGLAESQYASPYAVSTVCAALGKEDEAFRWLEAAYECRDPLLVCLMTDPRLDNLRSDRRFQDLLRRMNFPP